jgi:hypothetical protein
MLLKVDEIRSRMLLRGATRVTEYAYFKIAVCVLREFTLLYQDGVEAIISKSTGILSLTLLTLLLLTTSRPLTLPSLLLSPPLLLFPSSSTALLLASLTTRALPSLLFTLSLALYLPYTHPRNAFTPLDITDDAYFHGYARNLTWLVTAWIYLQTLQQLAPLALLAG